MKNKIFGIGFPKTGTTSMETAFELLGYNVCRGHWKNPHSNMAIAHAISNDYKRIKPIINSYDVFFDAPFGGCGFWRYLTTEYPEARFLLTTRDADDWYSSLLKMVSETSCSIDEDHLQTHYNRGRIAIVEFIREVWGIKDIVEDKQKLIRYYNDYNTEITTYFRNKDNFLNLEISQFAWKPLCKFIGQEIPKRRPFPYVNKTNYTNSLDLSNIKRLIKNKIFKILK